MSNAAHLFRLYAALRGKQRAMKLGRRAPLALSQGTFARSRRDAVLLSCSAQSDGGLHASKELFAAGASPP
jgi:hypothetical protein